MGKNYVIDKMTVSLNIKMLIGTAIKRVQIPLLTDWIELPSKTTFQVIQRFGRNKFTLLFFLWGKKKKKKDREKKKKKKKKYWRLKDTLYSHVQKQAVVP